MGEVDELPESRRRWKAWVMLTRDEQFHRVSLTDPNESEPSRRLLEMGYFAVPVDIIERPSP